MPVILTTPEEIEVWLEADIGAAVALPRSLPDDALRIVAMGKNSPSRSYYERLSRRH